MKTIGERIRWARLRHKPKITQRQIADYFQISSPSVTDWEIGKSNPTADKIPDLAKILGVNPLWLAFNVGLPEPADDTAFTVASPVPGGAVPVLDPTAAAQNIDAAIRNAEEYASSFTPVGPGAFYLFLRNDANAPTYPNGTRIMFDRDVEVVPGSMVFAGITRNGERQPFFGEYRESLGSDGNIVRTISPLNAKWAPAILNEATDHVRGVMIEFTITVQNQRGS